MKGAILHTLALALVLSLAASAADAKLVACVGDSITYGSGIADSAHDSYPAQLGPLLREFDPRWQTQNFGVSGATLLRSGDKPYVQQAAFNQALTAKPDVVVIKLGTNDSKSWNWVHKDDFVSDYLYLIDAFAQLPSAPEIWICKPVPAFSDNFGITNAVIRDEILPLIDQIAQQRNVGVIDLYTALGGASALFPDGIHPNAQGAGIIAEVVHHMIVGVKTLPDFDGSAKVDFMDLLTLTRHWLQSEPAFDIAPPPYGDGIVNDTDLAALGKYWLREIGLVAHWQLDEAEGDVAHDSAGGSDGTVRGGPLWQSEGGAIGGALQLDGLDDYISTPFVVNPSEGPLSIFAWVKGGAPGQVVISQTAGANWLLMDQQEGKLAAELKDPSRFGHPLSSQTVITDGNWHRIGFVWDGFNRMLYVDDAEAARDTQYRLAGSEGGLYIGTGQGLDSGSFWSGLIDDVRIYKRAVLP